MSQLPQTPWMGRMARRPLLIATPIEFADLDYSLVENLFAHDESSTHRLSCRYQ